MFTKNLPSTRADALRILMHKNLRIVSAGNLMSYHILLCIFSFKHITVGTINDVTEGSPLEAIRKPLVSPKSFKYLRADLVRNSNLLDYYFSVT